MSTRRLRSDLQDVRPAASTPEWAESLRADLKGWPTPSGAVRDADVLGVRLRAGRRHARPGRRARTPCGSCGTWAASAASGPADLHRARSTSTRYLDLLDRLVDAGARAAS